MTEGSIFHEAGKALVLTGYSKMTDVLVVVHPDGYMQAFSEGRVANVKFVMMPCVADDRKAEEWVELNLPFKWREIYCPGNASQTFLARQQKPSDIRLTEWKKEFLGAIQGVDLGAKDEQEENA